MLHSSRQRKVLTKRKCFRSAPGTLHSPIKKAKWKQWTNEQVLGAMEDVYSGTVGINEAAQMHDVPPMSWISGRVKHGTNSGPKQYLEASEENELAEFLKVSTAVGHGKTSL